MSLDGFSVGVLQTCCDHVTLSNVYSTDYMVQFFTSCQNYYCGADVGKVVYSSTNNVLFNFNSDGSVTASGYYIVWSCVNNTGEGSRNNDFL